jgi:hypothetical protein
MNMKISGLALAAIAAIATLAAPPAFASGGPPGPIDPISFVLPGPGFPADFGCPGFQTQVDLTGLDKVAAMNLHVYQEVFPQFRVTFTNLSNGSTLTVQSQSGEHLTLQDRPDGTLDVTELVAGPTVGFRPLHVSDGVHVFEAIWASRAAWDNGDDPIQVVQQSFSGTVRDLCPRIT